MMEPQAPKRPTVLLGLVLVLVLVLLGIQFVLGFRGFDHVRPTSGLLEALESPGRLLGWGGVLFLAVPVAWLVAGWAGRDLFGLQGPVGLVVRLMGAVALGLGVSGFLSLLGGGVALAGEVGVGLTEDVLGNLPGFVSALILGLLTLAGLLLTISPFFRSEPPSGQIGASMDALSDLEPPPGLYESSRAQRGAAYPERRYDEEGNEIPMDLDGRDVGPVRYLDDDSPPEEDAPAPAPAPPEPVEVVIDPDALPAGVRFADEPEPEAGAPPELVDVDDKTVPLLAGVRFADPSPPPDDEEEPDDADDGEASHGEDWAEEDVPEPDEGDAEDSDEEEPDAEGVDVVGVHVEAPDVREPVADVPKDETPKDEALEDDVEQDAEAEEDDADATAALDELKDEASGARYRAKLAGSGIFDEPEATPPTRPAAKKKAARKKAATRKKVAKKTAAKKKAAVKKPVAKKKAATKQATTTKTTPAKKTAATKKPTAKKKAAKKKSAAATSSRSPAAGKKGARAKGPDAESYDRAVEVAMERGAASSVLLSRRLGIGYSQARALIELLVEDEILGEMTPSGSRPLLVTAAQWKKRKRS